MNIYIKAMEIGSDNLDNGITYPNMITKLEQELKTKDSESKYKVLVSPDSKYNFAMWFVDNFSCRDFVTNYGSNNRDFKTYINRFYFYMHENLMLEEEFLKVQKRPTGVREEYKNQNKDYQTTIAVNKFFKQTFFLNGSTNKQYIDYLELVESRESSQKALEKADESIKLAKKSTNFAGWALVISIITAITSIGLSIYQLSRPMPDYPQPPYDVNINKTLDVKVAEPIEIKKIDTTKIK
ncbi:hypothetical protein [Galbibacter pacificus]|uniref:Uncharacterized protein n=1 Tax=Galbibacter pacificus TaxID=2996052 RepID=A0ABT6FQE7_9FLAO|nr:hypothetical protein [Galbibacter pacificus]MDG3582030.1 hypothetical protein [Galbibacter pacificus]MDG3585496.1 hypothetical protein [Galbibacter pacificus]